MDSLTAQEELESSVVHKNLESRMKIAGVEATDLLMALALSGMGNIIFGQTDLSFVFIVVIPVVFLVSFCLGKRGKPDKFLIHLVQYYLSSGCLSASEEPTMIEKQRMRVIL